MKLLASITVERSIGILGWFVIEEAEFDAVLELTLPTMTDDVQHAIEDARKRGYKRLRIPVRTRKDMNAIQKAIK